MNKQLLPMGHADQETLAEPTLKCATKNYQMKLHPIASQRQWLEIGI